MARVIPQERRGAAFGMTAGAIALGNAVGPNLGAGITAGWGMPAVFVGMGILYALAFGWVTFVVRRHELSRPQSGPATP